MKSFSIFSASYLKRQSKNGLLGVLPRKETPELLETIIIRISCLFPDLS